MSGTELARLGPFFAVQPAAGEPWRPLTELIDGPGLAERVAWTAASLGRRAGVDVDERIAASIASLGIFARLLSPVIGAAALDVNAPDLHTLRWQPASTGQLHLGATGWARPDPAGVLETLIAPLIDRLHDAHGLSRQIGRGNAASAANGAVHLVGRTLPAHRETANAMLGDLLEHRLLAGTADEGPPFVRRSCCLYYRLPGGGYCGDCVLAHTRS